MVTLTLDRMATGGITDHLGGGFHRYATDAEWLIPHFEKMLYNQALLVPVYLKAYELTANEAYADIVHRVLAFVSRELSGSHGGFLSALDAETNAIEGLYYLWHRSDIESRLGTKAVELFAEYSVEPMPEGELGGVLYRKTDRPVTPETRALLDELLAERSKR